MSEEHYVADGDPVSASGIYSATAKALVPPREGEAVRLVRANTRGRDPLFGEVLGQLTGAGMITLVWLTVVALVLYQAR